MLMCRYRTIYLSALGPAIAHALLLCTSLPTALAPTFAHSDIKTTIITGTVQCIDEVIPDEDDEDEHEGGMQVRQKSCVNIDIIIGEGERVKGATAGKGAKAGRKKGQATFVERGKEGKNS
jgi:ribonuclease P/MRP protein subunit RPP20